ncbi:MAG: TM2 domain-containing protein [Francisellaceae bacterium]|nr:TM2 domain-containing protein [Francisellaceae bacterium]
MSTKQSIKSGKLALLLCLFGGCLGFHRFYIGKIGTGILMLLTFGGLGVWTLIDLVFIVSNKLEDSSGDQLIFSECLPWVLVG